MTFAEYLESDIKFIEKRLKEQADELNLLVTKVKNQEITPDRYKELLPGTMEQHNYFVKLWHKASGNIY